MLFEFNIAIFSLSSKLVVLRIINEMEMLMLMQKYTKLRTPSGLSFGVVNG
jgi:hypothetical protein